MEEFQIDIVETKCHTNGAKIKAMIKAIGVGGGGGNMINHMISEGINSIDLIVANTDSQALESSLAPYKMQLGINATRGLGAGMVPDKGREAALESGMVPDKGREAALESFEDIKTMLEGSDIVFISAGLGGGTGTGAAPIIAQAAKEIGALTVSIVTSPFKFEGRKRTKLAKEGLEELKRESDSIIVVPNEKLLSIVEKNLGIKESFRMVDDILAQAVGGISKVILSHGENDINLDFADVKTVMSHRGLALMGAGYSTGTNAAYDAAKAAIESPLLDNISIDGAMGVLVHFDIHPDYPIMEIGEAMSIVEESADEDAAVIFGTTTNENMDIDEVKITIVATGFEDKNAIAEPTVKKQESLLGSSTTSINTIRSANRMVVGGYNGDHEDILDVPTFLRKQMD
jgi:cell division protein FtsZ